MKWYTRLPLLSGHCALVVRVLARSTFSCIQLISVTGKTKCVPLFDGQPSEARDKPEFCVTSELVSRKGRTYCLDLRVGLSTTCKRNLCFSLDRRSVTNSVPKESTPVLVKGGCRNERYVFRKICGPQACCLNDTTSVQACGRKCPKCWKWFQCGSSRKVTSSRSVQR